MKKKKLFWILVLVVFIAVIVVFMVIVKPANVENKNSNNNFNKTTNASENTYSKKNNDYIKAKLDDGILYSLDGKLDKTDIVIGDNYFDTTITDMYLNPENYKNKNIEIEGMYLGNDPYTFVGRFTTSSLCPYCPAGYSYVEYVFDGTIDEKLTNEKDWIKIIGTLEIENDETTGFQDFYYIKVKNFEIMNKRGNDTVKN